MLADAGHNLSDVLGLLLAWGAAYLATVKPSKRRTYGWRNSSILAAAFNGLILLVAVGGIVWEAIHRFYDSQLVTGSTVMLVTGVGVIVNGLTASLFLRGRRLVKPIIENEDHLRQQAARVLHDRFGIAHTTIQFERTDDADVCGQSTVDSL